MVDLFICNDLVQWSNALTIYNDVVKAVDEQKSKRKGVNNGQESLQSLDEWFQKDLPAVVASRSPPYLNHEELSKLMKWKLTRGKFRPRLSEMIKENAPSKVKELTTMAYSQLPNVKKSIETLKALKAVGPATASAILCIYKPDLAPFMSDEATIVVPGINKLDYSLKQYLTFAEAMCDKAEYLSTLNKEGDTVWTAHDVEIALWSYTIAKRLRPSLLEEKQVTRPNARPRTPTSDNDSLPPHAKRTNNN